MASPIAALVCRSVRSSADFLVSQLARRLAPLDSSKARAAQTSSAIAWVSRSCSLLCRIALALEPTHNCFLSARFCCCSACTAIPNCAGGQTTCTNFFDSQCGVCAAGYTLVNLAEDRCDGLFTLFPSLCLFLSLSS